MYIQQKDKNYYHFNLFVQKNILGIKYWTYLHTVSAQTVNAWSLDQLVESYTRFLKMVEEKEQASKKFPIIVEKSYD